MSEQGKKLFDKFFKIDDKIFDESKKKQDNKKKEKYKDIAIFVVIIVAAFTFSGFCFWAGKHLSYKFMYEDMVKKTVIEMVDPKYLN